MIINDFHVVGVSFCPFKADAPLIVNADAVLSFAVASQSFQSVGRRDAQIIQILCVIEHTQFPQGSLLDVRWKLARPLAQVDFVSLFVFEGFDHSRDCITPRAKRQVCMGESRVFGGEDVPSP